MNVVNNVVWLSENGQSVYSSASDSTATPPFPVAGFPVLCSPSNSDSKQYGEDFDGAVKLACLALSVENCKELQKICLQHLLRKKDVLAVLTYKC